MKSLSLKLKRVIGYSITKVKRVLESKCISTLGLNNLSNREAWLKAKLCDIPKGSRILDAGAGELQYKEYCNHLNYVSQDFGQYDGLGDSIGLQTKAWDNSKLDIISDIGAIPEPDNSFDAIMCIEVFEHLPSPIEAIKEFSRLLRNDGVLIITAPFASLTHFAPYHFYTGFNKYFYEKHLPENGFEIEEIIPNGNYFEYLAQEIRYRVPNQYSDKTLSKSQKQTVQNFLNILKELNSVDKGSSELLCFGYHVKARKI
ncbi:MAG: class I SAM-dependent methyltransferase [Bacteroidetes bacterium]|nr:class I SAM-dependent methyltransferase [Bacteroidota bacterium]